MIHSGVKGMRWGIRRYQNKDGSLTPAGKKKYGTKTNFEKVQAVRRAGEKKRTVDAARNKANARTEAEIAKLKKKYGLEDKKTEESSSAQQKKKSLSEMTDEELRNTINRTRMENEYKNLYPEQVSKGQRFVKSIANDVLAPAAKNIGRQYLEKTLKDKLGLNSKDGIEGLRKEVEKLRLEKERKDLKNPKKDPYKEKQEAIRNYSTQKAYDKMMDEINKSAVKHSDSGKKWTDSSKDTFSDSVSETPKDKTDSGKSFVSNLLLEDKRGGS